MSSLLYQACSNGDLSEVRYLLHHGHDVQEVDKFFWTPLHYASWFGRFDIVKHLVEECKANVQARNHEQITPFLMSAAKNNVAIVKFLAENNSDIHAKNLYGQSALHTAAVNGCCDTMRYLVDELKLDVNEKTKDGSDALHFCALNGQLACARYLIEECGADVWMKDNNGCTPHDLCKDLSYLQEVAKYLQSIMEEGGCTLTKNAAFKPQE